MQKKRIGIGISDFRELIEGDFLFIDKSLLVQETINAGAKILLIPRPRRFGKTLNLSMLRYFFERHDTEEETARHRRLFDGLAIRETEEFEQHFAKHPVIFLTFKDVKKTTFTSAMYKWQHRLRSGKNLHHQSPFLKCRMIWYHCDQCEGPERPAS